MLPIAQHGLFKDAPSFVTVCTAQGLVVKVTCMQDCRRRISLACKVLPFLPSTFVHHLPQTESLGIVAWLQHCGFLAACAKHGGFKESPDWCHEHPNFVLKFCLNLFQGICLIVTYTCLHTYASLALASSQAPRLKPVLVYAYTSACITLSR